MALTSLGRTRGRISVRASTPRAATSRRRAGGDPAGVLTYNVPQSMFENLSGTTFENGGSDYAAFLRSIRSREIHSYDYVEGPVLRNPPAFYAGKGPVTFGNQISFNTQTAIDIMNGYLR